MAYYSEVSDSGIDHEPEFGTKIIFAVNQVEMTIMVVDVVVVVVTAVVVFMAVVVVVVAANPFDK